MKNSHRFPLTLTQRDIYFDQLKYLDNPLYNVGGYIRIHKIKIDQLIQAHQQLIAKHDIYGLRIVSTEEVPYQYISTERTIDLPIYDFSLQEFPEKEANSWMNTLFETAIEIENQELFQACLIKLREDLYWYVGFAHHLAMDGWGFSNWARQLCQLYRGEKYQEENEGTWEKIAFQDEQYTISNKCSLDQEHWKTHCEPLPEKLLLPHYENQFKDRKKIQSSRKIITISVEEFQGLQSFSESIGVGVSHVFLGMLFSYFSSAHQQNKLVFGLPFHNRKNHAQKQMIGVFTSISPMCVDFPQNCTFRQLAKKVAEQQKKNFRHQRYPIGHLIRDLSLSGEHKSLYDIGFNYLKLDSQLEFDGTPADLFYQSHNHEATPLMFTVWEYGENLPVEIQLDYNFAYYSDHDIALLADRFSLLLNTLQENPDRPIQELEVIPKSEYQLLTQGFPLTPLDYSTTPCIHHRFEEQAEQTPNRIAVSSQNHQWTYQELNKKANQVAHYLIAKGVQPETLVGVCMERTANLLIAILGILKAGGAYLPLDISYPSERFQFILKDSQISFVLTEEHLAEKMAGTKISSLFLNEILESTSLNTENPAPKVIGLSSSNLAYVIYTSGSTGIPKGVEVLHRNVNSLVEWAEKTYSPTELSRVLASTSLNFDLSVFEMFVPLSLGHECVIVENALSLIDQHLEITLLNTVPSAIQALIEHKAIPDTVKAINLAGEPLSKHLLNALLASKKYNKVINAYGPTEDTVYSTYAIYTSAIQNQPTIGNTIPQTQAYILSPERKMVPWGGIGELHLAGAGVSRGYRNRPELTEKQFIKNPFSDHPNDRLYKTGDLVRWSGGELEFIGRSDDQVKIRGFRIELREIESQLSELPAVNSSVVLVKDNEAGQKYIAAYVTLKSKENFGRDDLSSRIRSELEISLPHYMIPSVFVFLEELPLTPNGKIDKRALPTPDPSLFQGKYTSPETETEIKLAEIWGALLKIDSKKISATTDFFSLGGNSLLIMKLITEIRNQFNVELKTRKVFDTVSLHNLASHIDSEANFNFIAKERNETTIKSEGRL